MPTLHGFAYSNYYNIPKHALLWKGVAFDEDLVYPSADGYDALSPARKVPALTTDGGTRICESSVLCDWIEDAYPDKPLYPADPDARAKVREVMKLGELYLELPCRRLIPYSFGGQDVPDALKAEVNGVVDRGVASMNALCSFAPHALGDTFTFADIHLRYVLFVVGLGAGLLDRDIVGEVDGMGAWAERMAADPVSQRVDADTEANKESFFAYIRGG